MFSLETLPEGFFSKKNAPLFTGILRGVERECLRTTPEGVLARTPHPLSLGSALTHPQITTDFSESLLEFITPPTHEADDLFEHLEAIHKYVSTNIGDEILWPVSMPCMLGEDKDIPVAQYGTSNNAKMKTVYRVGLGHRYGRSMQTVSGIHYNFSLPDAFWAFLSRAQNRIEDLQDFKDIAYFDLVRNFRRHYWLLIYLFGASPAMCKSFIKGKQHNLEFMEDGHTLHLPYATSLRMGDLGYQSKVQESLYVCYNSKADYIQSLCCAITQAHPDYEKIGVKDANGDYKQLNTSILQIENEFYSAIRPKRTAKPGETALTALRKRGVEYIEVRCLDVNPDSPYGISPEQIYFLDTFLVYCAIAPSADTSPEEAAMILRNQKKVVTQGRAPEVQLESAVFGSVALKDWGESLMKAMAPIAQLLDDALQTEVHQQALDAQHAKLRDSELTPSAKILNTLRSEQLSFPKYALAKAAQHRQFYNAIPLGDNVLKRMSDMAEESLAEQSSMEARSTESFENFLQHYFKQYAKCAKRKDGIPCGD